MTKNETELIRRRAQVTNRSSRRETRIIPTFHTRSGVDNAPFSRCVVANPPCDVFGTITRDLHSTSYETEC